MNATFVHGDQIVIFASCFFYLKRFGGKTQFKHNRNTSFARFACVRRSDLIRDLARHLHKAPQDSTSHADDSAALDARTELGPQAVLLEVTSGAVSSFTRVGA